MLLVLLPAVSAADGDTDPGLTPDSTFYFLDKLIEKLDLALTFDDVSKTEKFIKYAQERLAEAEEMNTEEKDEFIEELLLEYVEMLEQASDNLLDLDEEDADDLEGDLDAAIGDSDELSDMLDPELAARLEDKKGQAYIKFTVLREALTNENQEAIVEKANEAGFGLGELSKIAIGAELLSITLEEALDAVIEVGDIEEYFESQGLAMSELIVKGVEKKQERLQLKLTDAIDNGDEEKIQKIEKQIQKSVDREVKHEIITNYQNQKKELLSEFGVNDLDELSEEEQEQMKAQLNQIKDEKKESLKTFLDEKKQGIHNAIEEAKSDKDKNKNNDDEFTGSGLVKLEEKIKEKSNNDNSDKGTLDKGNSEQYKYNGNDT